MTVEISTDPSRIDIDFVFMFLSGSYWAPGIPLDVVRRSIDHSLPFSAFDGPRQVGFARVISDLATFAYIADVFVIETHRGAGIGQKLMNAIMADPRLQNLRRWMLVTRDAHGLYEKFGFVRATQPERVMERRDPDVYRRMKDEGS